MTKALHALYIPLGITRVWRSTYKLRHQRRHDVPCVTRWRRHDVTEAARWPSVNGSPRLVLIRSSWLFKVSRGRSIANASTSTSERPLARHDPLSSRLRCQRHTSALQENIFSIIAHLGGEWAVPGRPTSASALCLLSLSARLGAIRRQVSVTNAIITNGR